MNPVNDIEVIINGKRYILSGYESGEYLQKTAAFINKKVAELKKQEFYKLIDSEMRNVVLQINLADEYFKLKDRLEEIEHDSDSKSNEIYSYKHEIMSLRSKLDASLTQIEELKKENINEQKKVVKLETELEQLRGSEESSDAPGRKRAKH